ncbi:hypothetical protein N0V88_004793 [Collariella sp. IMI 366227]|nr:hypothetical protein N0V88_004793 [Collariella sp. IMI 366227]
MAKVEHRTEELLKPSSFQRMLELEKKYKKERAQEREEEPDVRTPTSNEPLEKLVKSVTPERGVDEDAMSEHSSICQSPSWEGYGQRKKEKKLEAERRKREKEQADKEAKAAKKRNTSRLSKLPPPSSIAKGSKSSDYPSTR